MIQTIKNSDLPSEIVFEITYRCNLNCFFCFNKCYTERIEKKELNTNSVKKIIDAIKKSGVKQVRFTGGEPLLRKDIFTLLKYAKSEGLKVWFNTNCTLINKGIARKLSLYVENVLIPLNGYDTNSEFISTYVKAFNRKIKGINLLKETNIPVVRAGTVATKYNITHLERIYNLVKKLNLDDWELFRPISIPNNLRPIKNEDVGILAEKLIRINKINNTNYLIANSIPFCAYNPVKLNQVARGATADDGHARFIINPEGYAKPSYYLTKIIGNPIRERIEDIWRSKFMQDMRNLKFPPKYCHNCLYLKKCKGGNRAIANLLEGSYKGSDYLAKPLKYREQIFTQTKIRYNNLLGYLLKNQWMPKEHLKKLQFRKFKSLLQNVYNNNKFYHQLYKKEGIVPSDIKNLEDINRLPVVKKEDLQQYYLDFVSKPSEKLLKTIDYYSRFKDKFPRYKRLGACTFTRTSGTSGLPLIMFFDDSARNLAVTASRRAYLSIGWNFDEPILMTTPYSLSDTPDIKEISIFDLPEQQLEELNKYKNYMYCSYPTILFSLADHLHNNKVSINFPNRILSTAELLMDIHRKKIEKTFNCKMYDSYGSAEFHMIAFECSEREGYHINMERLIVECLDKNNSPVVNKIGKFMVTDLTNYQLPLIRYDIGDSGILTDELCKCNRGLSLIKKLVGRNNNFIKTENGKIISPILFDVILSNTQGIKKYQFIQKKINLFEINIVKKEDFKDENIPQINMEINKIVPFSKINFNFVDDVPLTEGGKLKTVISKVD